MIYLDQAATSYPKPPQVAEAMVETLKSAGNSGRGGHHLSLAASRLAFQARAELAAFFGAEDPSCIAFTANATESLNLALFGLLNPGDHVITTELEHNSVLRPLYILKTNGVDVTILPPTPKGTLILPGAWREICAKTREWSWLPTPPMSPVISLTSRSSVSFAVNMA